MKQLELFNENNKKIIKEVIDNTGIIFCNKCSYFHKKEQVCEDAITSCMDCNKLIFPNIVGIKISRSEPLCLDCNDK